MKKTVAFLFVSLLLLFYTAINVWAADSPYAYEDMERDLKAAAERNPEHTELTSLGKTPDGREIWCFREGKKDAGTNILIFGGIHAREYITAKLVTQMALDFAEDMKKADTVSVRGVALSELMKDSAVYFLPMTNPDGVTISQFGTERIQKDEVKAQVYRIYEMDGAVEIDPYLRKWKSNANGVDLNRQFDALWEQYDDHVGHPSADHYKGSAPGTEPEAKTLIDLTEQVKFSRTISYHTQGKVIYWYFGQTGNLKEKTKRFADRIAALTGYKTDANYESLDPAGYKDWVISKKGIPSLTIEVGYGENPVPESQFGEICRENRQVVYETLYNAIYE